MPTLFVHVSDRQHVEDLAEELLALIRQPDCPRGVLCAVLARLAFVLSERDRPQARLPFGQGVC